MSCFAVQRTIRNAHDFELMGAFPCHILQDGGRLHERAVPVVVHVPADIQARQRACAPHGSLEPHRRLSEEGAGPVVKCVRGVVWSYLGCSFPIPVCLNVLWTYLCCSITFYFPSLFCCKWSLNLSLLFNALSVLNCTV